MPLDDNEVAARLGRLTGWQRQGDAISKEFRFPDFRAAITFVNRVADAAERADHHPDIIINYDRVRMTLSTHSEGGLTEKDFALASEIDAAA
jgi:4a-hydroxytetrahydrobiopterin dehydratase